MKKLLIALLMISGIANAQTITNQPQGAVRQRWQLLGGLKVDSSFQLPWRDTSRYGSNGFFSDLYINKADSLLKFRDPRTGVSMTISPSGGGTIPNLEQVTTGSGNNVSSHGLAASGMDGINVDSQRTVLYDYAVFVDGGGIGHTSGGNFRRMLEYSEAAGQTILYNDAHTQTILLREQTSSSAGIVASGRIRAQAAINPDDVVILSQVDTTAPTLQSVTTGAGKNVTTNIIQVAGFSNIDLTKSSTALLHQSTVGGIYRIDSTLGTVIGAVEISDSVVGLSSSTESLNVRPETPAAAGVLISSRIEGDPGLNDNDYITMRQLRDSSTIYPGSGIRIENDSIKLGINMDDAGLSGRLTTPTELGMYGGSGEGRIQISDVAIGLSTQSGSDGSFINVQRGVSTSTATIRKQYSGNAQELIFNADNDIILLDGINNSGIKYNSKYRDDITNRSVMDKEYIDSMGAAITAGAGTVTAVTGTTNRITSTGGTTPAIDISSSYVGQGSITTVGSLTTGSLGSGFTGVTPSASDSTTKVSTTAYVKQVVGTAVNADSLAKFIRQGGNTYGTTVDIGSNDAQAVSFRVNGSAAGAFLANGNFRVNNGVIQNSTTSNNATVTLGVTGTVIASNKANADNVLTTNNANGSSTGLNIVSQNAGSSTFSVSKTGNVIANGTMNIGGLSTLGSNSIAATHTLTIPSVGTGFVHYNTVDQITNLERFRAAWISNVYTMGVESSGSGTNRSFRFNAGVGSLTLGGVGLSGVLNFAASASTANLSFFGLTGTHSAASGIQNAYSILPTYTQTSTAGYRVLWISPLETTTGSGIKELVNFGINSGAAGSGTHTSRLSLASNGDYSANGTTFAGVYSTSSTISGSTSSLALSAAGIDLNSLAVNGYGTSERKQLTVDTSGIVTSMSMMEDTVIIATLLTPGDDNAPVTIATIPIATNVVYDVEVRANGRQADGVDASAKMNLEVLATNVSGTVVINGQANLFNTIKSAALLLESITLTASASGANLLIQISPSDAYIMQWKAYISISKRSL